MKGFIHWIKDGILSFIMIMLRVFPIEQNKIIFMSFFGKGYNDNPMLISNRFENVKGVKVIWATEKNVKCPEGIIQVYNRSLRYLYELATSKVWVDNARKYIWIKKRRGQFYIQTWHGPVCIKAVEKDAGSVLGKRYINSAKQDSKNANIIVAECKWRKQNIINAFWYKGDILEASFNKQNKTYEEAQKAVKQFYKLSDEKVVLYAPTFRNDGNIDAYDLDYNRLLDQLHTDGNKWKIIVRLHPNIANNSRLICYTEDVLNGTAYPDIADLIETSEYVITDYSGLMFDAMRSSKKVLLFALDLDEYIKSNRDLYFDIKKLPAPLALNNEELIYNIKHFDDETYERKRKKLIDDLGYYEEDAAEACEKIIVSKLRIKRGE